jgi:hypothetical protein
MRGDEIAGGKDVADENPRLDFTLPDDVFSSDQPSCHLSAGLTLPSRFQSVPAGLGPDGDETCLPDDRERLFHQDGGARRDRTDDLMLAKHALYQLSYGPVPGTHVQGSRPTGDAVRVGRPGQTRTADLTLIRRTL